VLINLIGNGVKFTQQGGVIVRLGTKQDKMSNLVIEVEDSGPGVPLKDLQHIFEPFVQLGEHAISQGTGLGLAITRQYVQLMGGTISVESTIGKGSLFRVELPLEEAAADEVVMPEMVARGEIIGPAPNQPVYRILIVEDQLENQLLLTQLMENVGLQVKLAENGEQGVQLFQSWQPHLIWMDRRMPMTDGLEATKIIRRLPNGKDVKIVAVTASAFIEQRDEMINAGMDDFVRKPYRTNEIYECLTRQLGMQYSYSDTQPTVEAEIVPLTAEMLSVLPSKLRNELCDALEVLDSELISTVIEKVGSHDANLQNTLSRLADNFDYAVILNALRTDSSDNKT